MVVMVKIMLMNDDNIYVNKGSVGVMLIGTKKQIKFIDVCKGDIAVNYTKRNIEKRLAANNHSHIHHTNKHCIDEQRNTYKIDSHNNETERKAALERAFTEHRLLDKIVYMHTHTLRDDYEMKQYSGTICNISTIEMVDFVFLPYVLLKCLCILSVLHYSLTL